MEARDSSGIKENAAFQDAVEIQIPPQAEELLGEFIESTTSKLEELEAATLAYESPGDGPSRLPDIRRILHTIKGDAGIVGIDQIYEFCHQAESVLEILPDEQKGEMLLKTKDWLGAALRQIKQKAAPAASARCIGGASPMNRDRTKSRVRRPRRAEGKLKILIVEDDFASRFALQHFLCEYGTCFVVVNGSEAIEAVRQAIDQDDPYDLICLDIMMPEMDGRKALKAIRELEAEHGIEGLDSMKVIMTTALYDGRNVFGSFRDGCEAYIVKPIEKERLAEEIRKLGLIRKSSCDNEDSGR